MVEFIFSALINIKEVSKYTDINVTYFSRLMYSAWWLPISTRDLSIMGSRMWFVTYNDGFFETYSLSFGIRVFYELECLFPTATATRYSESLSIITKIKRFVKNVKTREIS